MSTPLDITFGVEIEFLLACHPTQGPIGPARSANERIAEYNKNPRRDVRWALHAAGLEVSWEDQGDGEYKTWTVVGDSSVEPDDDLKQTPCWCRGSRVQLPERQLQDLQYWDVEVVSPILRLNAKSFSDIQNVITTITSRFTVFTPESAGLHVHVGNKTSGFSLQAVKNLAMLVCCFERQFNQLHPGNRLNNYHCRTPSYEFNRHRHHPQETVKRIEDFTTLSQLILNFQGGDCGAYNLYNLDYGEKRTIEFRQHAGTLEFPKIYRWVVLCCALIKLVHVVEPEDLREFILTHSRKSNFSILDLLRALRLEDVAEMFENSTYEHKLDDAEGDKGGSRWVL